MTQIEMGALMGQIGEQYIHEALTTYGQRGSVAGKNRAAKTRLAKAPRQLRRTLLLAAVAAALLTVAALAAALWGLRERVLPAERTVTAMDGKSYAANPLSLAGIEGSAEYAASAEWIAWHTAYEAAQPAGWIDDNWIPADDAMQKAAWFYGCYDDAMLQKLLEISRRHGLKLHSLSTAPISMEDFYALAGTAAFTRGDNQPTGGYIYEDGSFRLDGESDLCADGMYTLLRNMAGTLPPMESFVWDQEGYSESAYRTALGAEVVVARHATLPTFIFYESGGAFLQLSARLADEASARALADTVDFAAACAGEPRVLEMTSAAPKAVEAAGAVTLADFAASPEYQGLRAFVDYIHANGIGNYSGLFPVPEAYKGDYPDGFEAKTAEICETYGLTAHSGERMIIDYAEALRAAGAGSFILAPEDEMGKGFGSLRLYEDGSFNMNYGFLYYIRKGSLCTDSQYVASWLDLPAYETSWQYETASGAVVCCATGARQASLVLYETPKAWVLVLGGDYDAPPYALESIAERYDFTKLP